MNIGSEKKRDNDEKVVEISEKQTNPYQIYYEEDILEHRDDIIGHYRIS